MSAARWYIVHAHSGFEKKVADSIKEKAQQKGMTQLFEEVTVPVENVTEVRKGKKVNAEKKFFPGYVLVKMQLNDDTWHLVKSIPKVTGFLGGQGNKPQPISDSEAQRIFQQMQDGVSVSRAGLSFDVGETVKIIDGPFESFTGNVENVDTEKQKLKVAVSIFGRSTPVELDYIQVEKA